MPISFGLSEIPIAVSKACQVLALTPLRVLSNDFQIAGASGPNSTGFPKLENSIKLEYQALRDEPIRPWLGRFAYQSRPNDSKDPVEALRTGLASACGLRTGPRGTLERVYYSHRALTTCAVSSWESEELDERPHALFLTAGRKSLGSC